MTYYFLLVCQLKHFINSYFIHWQELVQKKSVNNARLCFKWKQNKKSHTAIKFYDGKMMIYALEILRIPLTFGYERWYLCVHIRLAHLLANLFAKLTHLKQTKFLRRYDWWADICFVCSTSDGIFGFFFFSARLIDITTSFGNWNIKLHETVAKIALKYKNYRLRWIWFNLLFCGWCCCCCYCLACFTNFHLRLAEW